MAFMIMLQNVELRRGARELFHGVDLAIFRGDKVGITGANGSGKTSLLALLRGELQADSGSVAVPAGLRIASVAQETPPVARTAHEYVLDGDQELRALEAEMQEAELAHDGARIGLLHARYEAVGGYTAPSRAARLLDGVGFATTDLPRSVGEFSGGWRMRLNLAQALMCRSDLLLLDEPTNHLDLDAVLWLETWLAAYEGTLLVISHDREFLDRVATRIVHIERNSVRAYSGNYSQFELQRAAELAVEQALYERQQREIRHVMQFVERFRAKATKARQVQSRLKVLERMQRIAPAHVDAQFAFEFREPEKLPRPLLGLEEQSVGYGGAPVLAGLDLILSPGGRIAILGRNGAGKSTLARLLAGELQAGTGRRVEANDLRIGYFAQHHVERLDAESSPFAHVRRFAPEFERGTEQALRDHLGGFGFRGDRVFEPVAAFSGGERARLMLAMLVAQRPNLLILDEPTNHLDLDMRHALGMALQDFSGALVVVSHDRHLIRSIADELWLVHDGRLEPFDGDLDDYAAWLSGLRARREAEVTDEAPAGAAARRARKRAEAERRNQLSPLRAAVRTAEEDLTRLGQERLELERALADPTLYTAGSREELARILDRQRAVTRSVTDAETRWLQASEALEAAERQS